MLPDPPYFCDLCWQERRATVKKVAVGCGVLLCPVCDDEAIRQIGANGKPVVAGG